LCIQTLESFWALLKRGIMGSLHHVSTKYLPIYLAEFSLPPQFTARPPNMFDLLIAGC
jgi:ISXO2-like transposase domain